MLQINHHFYKTIPCKGGRQGIYQQGNEAVMLHGNIEGRIFSIF